MDVRGFRDLRVWQAAMDLVEMTYKFSLGFPKHETYGLTSQIRRAAISIPSNIAEGHSRKHTKEYLKFLSVAQGSLAELQTQIEIAGRLGYVTTSAVSEILDYSVSLSKQLHALRNAIVKRGE
jgi:four helix bundle protein